MSIPKVSQEIFSYLQMPKVIFHGIKEMGFQPVILMSTITVADAAFQYLSENNLDLFRKVYAHQFTLRFTLSIAMVCSGRRLYQNLASRVKDPEKLTLLSFKVCGIIILIIPMIIPISFFIVTKVLNRLQESRQKAYFEDSVKEEINLQELKDVAISWKKPQLNEDHQTFLFIQQVAYLALAIFSKSHLTYTALSVANLYNLYQVTQQNWVCITREAYDDTRKRQIRFEYRAIFLPKKQMNTEEKEKCLCLETPEKTFFVCPRHAYCMSCLTSFFIETVKNFKVVNDAYLVTQEGKVKSFQVCIDQDRLPNCPIGCGVIWQNHLSISIKNEEEWKPSKIIWLNYKLDQKIQLILDHFNPQDLSAYGELVDGTIICIKNVKRSQTDLLIRSKKTIEAQITKKTIEGARLNLTCISNSLKEYEVGEELIVKIVSVKTHQGSRYAIGRLEDGTLACLKNLSDDIANEFIIGQMINVKFSKVIRSIIVCTSDFLQKSELP